MLIVLLSVIVFELFVMIRLLTNIRLFQDGESEARVLREHMREDIYEVLRNILTEVRKK